MIIGKNDKKTLLVLGLCMGIMQQDVTIYDKHSKPIYDEIKTSLNASFQRYYGAYTSKLEKDFLELARYVETLIPVNTKWIPLLLINELLGAWFSENGKHLHYWQNFDYARVYDHLTPETAKTRDLMFECAEKIIYKIQGKKKNKSSAVKLKNYMEAIK